MSLHPQPPFAIPQATQRVAHTAFPKGTLCRRIADQLGDLYRDDQFAEVFPTRGQPAASPARLAWVAVLQYVEGLADRQAADAVPGRIDGKYALALELDDPGFYHAVLSEFRSRLVNTELVGTNQGRNNRIAKRRQRSAARGAAGSRSVP
jgi:transposase